MLLWPASCRFAKPLSSENSSFLQDYSVFGKAVKKTLFYIIWTVERCINRNASVNAALAFPNYLSKLFVDFRKVDLSPKLLKTFWFSLALSFWTASVGKRMHLICWECKIQISIDILVALQKYHFLDVASNFKTFRFVSYETFMRTKKISIPLRVHKKLRSETKVFCKRVQLFLMC